MNKIFYFLAILHLQEMKQPTNDNFYLSDIGVLPMELHQSLMIVAGALVCSPKSGVTI